MDVSCESLLDWESFVRSGCDQVWSPTSPRVRLDRGEVRPGLGLAADQEDGRAHLLPHQDPDEPAVYRQGPSSKVSATYGFVPPQRSGSLAAKRVTAASTSCLWRRRAAFFRSIARFRASIRAILLLLLALARRDQLVERRRRQREGRERAGGGCGRRRTSRARRGARSPPRGRRAPSPRQSGHGAAGGAAFARVASAGGVRRARLNRLDAHASHDAWVRCRYRLACRFLLVMLPSRPSAIPARSSALEFATEERAPVATWRRLRRRGRARSRGRPTHDLEPELAPLRAGYTYDAPRGSLRVSPPRHAHHANTLKRQRRSRLALDDYTPSTITRVYAADGQVIGEFATQRRVIISYDDVNPLLRQAIIATEDAEFDRHFGVNIWRIFVAAVTDIIERRRAQGASTLTQQLARNLRDHFGLTNEKSFERKIKEAILAIQIEKRYTKKEIFTIIATRCTWVTAPTAWRQRPACISTRPRSS